MRIPEPTMLATGAAFSATAMVGVLTAPHPFVGWAFIVLFMLIGSGFMCFTFMRGERQRPDGQGNTKQGWHHDQNTSIPELVRAVCCGDVKMKIIAGVIFLVILGAFAVAIAFIVEFSGLLEGVGPENPLQPS